MNNSGFTLIEIIAVVGLLAVIGMMIGTNLVSMNQKQNLKNYENYKRTISDAACIFFESDTALFYSTIDGAKDRVADKKVTRDQCLTNTYCYTSTYILKSRGYIDTNLKNPATQANVTNTEFVKVSFEKGVKTCTYQ